MSYTPFSERILPENHTTRDRQNEIKKSDKEKGRIRRQIEIIHEQIALKDEYSLPDDKEDNHVEQPE